MNRFQINYRTAESAEQDQTARKCRLILLYTIQKINSWLLTKGTGLMNQMKLSLELRAKYQIWLSVFFTQHVTGKIKIGPHKSFGLISVVDCPHKDILWVLEVEESRYTQSSHELMEVVPRWNMKIKENFSYDKCLSVKLSQDKALVVTFFIMSKLNT